MNIKKLTLFIGMFLILITGQNSAVALNYSSVSLSEDGTEFKAEITFVGTDSTTLGEITESGGTYDVVSSSGFGQVTVKADVSGHTNWADKFNATGEKDAATATGGHLMLIVDGSVSTIGGGILGTAGILVGLSEGDHSITLLWAGLHEDGTFASASDTIVVRVRPTDNFKPYAVTNFPLKYDVEDNADVANTIEDEENIYWSWDWYDYYKNVSKAGPAQDLTFTYGKDETEIDGQLWTDVAWEKFIFSGTVNTLGYKDSAVEYPYGGYPNTTTHDTTVGRSFLVDATGVKLIDEAFLDDPSINLRNSVGDKAVYTYVGVMSLSDAGVFYWGDIEGITSYGEDDKVDFSFDFLYSIDGGFLAIPNVTFETKAPGFGLLGTVAGVFTIAIVAFVIPRKTLRKEE
jgi:hypothetical protein